MTAENLSVPVGRRHERPGFNEAAADDRGKLPGDRALCSAATRRFNEAAADDRGKPITAAKAAANLSRLQ